MRQPLTLQSLGLSEEDLETGPENTPDPESLPPQPEPEDTPTPEPQPDEPPAETPPSEGDVAPPEPEPEPQGKPYTPEELRDLVARDGTLDASRLTDDQRASYREFQRDYTRKTQELATLRKELEHQQVAPQPQPQSPADPIEQLYGQYRQNPRSIVRDINQNIAQLRTIQPHDDNYAQAQSQISQLELLKDDFSMRFQDESASTRMARDAEQTALSRLQAQIPDLKSKASKLEEFAISAGMAKQDLALLTNPALVGPDTTVRVTLAINSWYEAEQARTKAKAKQARPKPPELQHPAGTHEPAPEDELENMPFGEFEKAFMGRMKRRRYPNGKPVS